MRFVLRTILAMATLYFMVAFYGKIHTDQSPWRIAAETAFTTYLLTILWSQTLCRKKIKTIVDPAHAAKPAAKQATARQ